MKENRFIKRRVLGIMVIALSTILFSLLMGSRAGMALDEMVVLFFLDFVFLAVLIYFLEEERVFGFFPGRESNDFKTIAVVYLLGMAGNYLFTYLPEYITIAFAFAVLMTLASNRETALTMGIFMNLMLAVILNQDIHALMASILMTLFGTMISLAGRKKQSYLWVQFLVFFGTIVIVVSCYYAQYLLIRGQVIFLAGTMAVLNLFVMEIAGKAFFPKTEKVKKSVYTSLLSEEYPLVQSIRHFSEIDYSHGVRVSCICGECARYLSLNEELCRAAGFYYRIGRMEGEPYIENGVLLAENACFPRDLIQILKEYNGELTAISSRESAVVHMVDRVVTKLDLMDKKTFSTNWNQDMLIYQTLNEDSATGIYDESGLSMNQFLKIRDFLVKGDHLF